jgi:co-chaperonin GroES (HSP10)
VKIITEEKTDGGLIIPDVARARPQLHGEVISVGEAVHESITVGSVIACHERAGMDIMLNGKVYKILKYDEVYGIIQEVNKENA